VKGALVEDLYFNKIEFLEAFQYGFPNPLGQGALGDISISPENPSRISMIISKPRTGSRISFV
jgi:hypothetical protein